ncbi:PIN domain nuclease [Spirosoma sp. KUDC1026]|uniref:type II toxin-antitoxin system VapC family toxin n=1 Tax=Spirosoma sp. KUDC1026 TaxID=2745947 RepID=UPI00159BCEC0|nr:PIN domain nuclease [Spirosoma sp. KUDC1026]QKZ12494.1 PIN domain nuclease [Spirosoma sp. KUDC1026]
MDSLLVDTSVWIDWLNKKRVDTWQTALLDRYFLRQKPVFITAIVLQEVLQGIWEDTLYEDVKHVLSDMIMLTLDPVEAAIGAADLYRSLRKKGVTIRKPNDCLIAYYALMHGLPVLHNDVDFDQIARYTTLRVVDL